MPLHFAVYYGFTHIAYHTSQDTQDVLCQTAIAASVLFMEKCLYRGILFTTTSPPPFFIVLIIQDFLMQCKQNPIVVTFFSEFLFSVICKGFTHIAHTYNSKHTKCSFSNDNRRFYSFQRVFLGEKCLLEANSGLTNTLYSLIIRTILRKCYCGDYVFFTFLNFFRFFLGLN